MPIRTPLRCSLLLLAAAGLSACSSSPSPAPQSFSIATPPSRDGLASLGLRLEWTGYAPVVSGGSLTNFEVLGDALIVQDSSAICSLLSPAGGDVRWSTPLGGPTTRVVGNARVGSRFAVCSEAEVFILDDLTGNILGRQRLERVATTAPAQLGDLLIFGGTGPSLFAHSTATGYAAWVYGVRGPFDAAPVLLNDLAVAAATRSGDVLIIEPPTGKALTRASVFDGPRAAIAASPSTAFVAARDQSVYAFRPGDSRPLWRARTDSPLNGSAAHHDGRVFTVVPSRGLSAFDAATGKPLWSTAAATGSVVAVRAGRLLTWNGTDAALIDAASGAVIGSTPIPGAAWLVPDRFEMTAVYAVSPSGAIHKLTPR